MLNKKNIIFLLIPIILFILVLLINNTNNSDNYKKNIVFYGDSNTRFNKNGKDQNINKSFSNLLKKYFINDRILFKYASINRGYSGRTAVVAAYTANKDIITADNPTTVWLCFGTNDIKIASPDLIGYLASMRNIIDTLQAAGVKVVISTILDFDNNYGANGAASRALIPVWNEQLKTLALEKGCLIFDWNLVIGNTNINDLYGDLPARHINKKGHEITAKAVFTFISEHLIILEKE